VQVLALFDRFDPARNVTIPPLHDWEDRRTQDWYPGDCPHPPTRSTWPSAC